jgi:antitoxin ChpS
METTLRNFGNSVGLVIPKILRDALRLVAGQHVILEQTEQGLLIRSPTTRRYSLEELVAQCDANAPDLVDQDAWNNAPAVGREVW